MVKKKPSRLLALNKLLEETPYSGYNLASTMTENNPQVYDERNLVILSRFEMLEYNQYRHDFAHAPQYRKVTAQPEEQEAKDVSWERPILYAKIKLDDEKTLHVINLHLKSRLPSFIDGQKVNQYTWKTASGWAEGFFLSSIKRVGQALETRILVDNLFDNDEDAMIVVCGDFNSESEEVPVQAIRGDVENTGNGDLTTRVLVSCEMTIPEPSRFSLLHMGKGRMLDHLLVSRSLLSFYKGTEIHNEVLHDESIAFATDKKYPESDHAPIIAEFDIPV
jgi:endonuclease/exonuclease/phosphatase family metal-dependent hydrolase